MYKDIVKFLFEVEILREMPRSGFSNLGGVRQSIAEHSFAITMIAYCMAKLEADVDEAKLIKMCLLHDVAEARIGDLNYINKQYAKADEEKAIRAQAAKLPFGDEYIALMKEFEEAETKEAKLAKDADQLELLLVLKRAKDIGHQAAQKWIDFVSKKIKTETGKKLAESIKTTENDSWWFPTNE